MLVPRWLWCDSAARRVTDLPSETTPPSAWRVPALVYFATFTLFAISPLKVHTDSIWSIPTAVRLLDQRNIDLDEYAQTIALQSHGIVTVRGHFYNFYPLAPSLVAVPLLFIFDRVVGWAQSLRRYFPKLDQNIERWKTKFHAVGQVDLDFYDTIEMIIASLLVSGATVFMFLTARRQASTATALATCFLFAFCTPAYSTASRVLWQHSPSILAISAVIYLLSHPLPRWYHAVLLGVAATAAYTSRPTNSITLVVIAIYLIFSVPRLANCFFIGCILVATPFCIYSQRTYGTFLPPYFQTNWLSMNTATFPEALAGNLVSPGRGLFVYSPVLLLSCYGYWRKLRSQSLARFEQVFPIVIALHWIAVSLLSPIWWAGHAFGPRFFTDVVPYFAYFLISPVDRVLVSRRVTALSAALAATTALSLFIHVRGSSSYATWDWNNTPANVDSAPRRVWEWSDLAFLRGL